MTHGASPYFDPDFDIALTDAISPPRVVIDNETQEDCTLVKVDSQNKFGILLEMVQLLTDLDLVISKCYVSSDGDWLMDVFHVTDQLGGKLTDPRLASYVQQKISPPARRRAGGGTPAKVTTCLGNVVGPIGHHHSAERALSVEVTATDQPGLLSEIAAVLTDLGCHVASGQAWTHGSRAALILYVTAGATAADTIESRLRGVLGAHVHSPGERPRPRVRVRSPQSGARFHTERRLHQMMREDGDYDEAGPVPPQVDAEDQLVLARRQSRPPATAAMETRVTVEKERGYWVVSMTGRDRPKLMFDTVCALTDMNYVVFHASAGTRGPLAVQEYYVRPKDGLMRDEESEQGRLTRCLVAAVERRVSHGRRLDMRTADRPGLLADVLRVIRENGLSLARTDFTINGDKAVGTFYVTSFSGGDADIRAAEDVRDELAKSGDAFLVSEEAAAAALSPEEQADEARKRKEETTARCRRAGKPAAEWPMCGWLWSHLVGFLRSFFSCLLRRGYIRL